MALDINQSYNQIDEKIEAAKVFNSLKRQYRDATKKAADNKEKKEEELKTSLDDAKKKINKIKDEVKNQFDRLLELLVSTSNGVKEKGDELKDKINQGKNLNNVGGDSNTARYIKVTFLKVLKNIEPKILEILNEESLNAVGCDQQQVFTPTTFYIKVKSIDISGLLKIDPTSDVGKVLYERANIQVQTPPFSMNRELYNRIKNPSTSYLTEYGQDYVGASGQKLFNIQFFQNHPLNGEGGGWYGITLYNRYNNINKVGEFMVDYYKTIKLFEFQNLIAGIMEKLCGAISIDANFGPSFVTDATKFEKILMRVLGLCFDNANEIDVSGVSKVSDVPIDDSFFEFTDIDLRNIEKKVDNIRLGVVEYENCGNVKLPVDSKAILDSINKLNFVKDFELIRGAEIATDSLADNPAWNGITINGNIKANIDLNFLKLMTQGLITTLLSPKILLPIMTMLKALNDAGVDLVDSLMEFAKKFRKFLINLVSKIGGLFIKELFELIKKDIKNLIQQIVLDVAKEQGDKRIIMILKLVQILIVVSRAISDWRSCKSIVDEILWLLRIATTGFNFEIPLPLLFASQLLDGYSESRAFLGALGELQKIGVPVGPMPDGSPNLDILSKYAQMKAMANEEAENGKVLTAIPPLEVTPAGFTLPRKSSGKKM